MYCPPTWCSGAGWEDVCLSNPDSGLPISIDPTKKKMSKEIYAMLKGEKVVLGSVNSKKQFTFREDIDMSIVSKKTMERLEDVYEILKPKQR